MIDDFIGGGQVFLHKITMFMQVLGRSLSVTILLSLILTCLFNYQNIIQINVPATTTYFKALSADTINNVGKDFKSGASLASSSNDTLIKILGRNLPRNNYNKTASSKTDIKSGKAGSSSYASTNTKLSNSKGADPEPKKARASKSKTPPHLTYFNNLPFYLNTLPPYMPASRIISDPYFISAKDHFADICLKLLLHLFYCSSFILTVLFFMWSKLGVFMKKDKHISGSTIKSAKEVSKYLTSSNKASYLTIGDMPLIKDSETKHMLITGSTGTGKTNLLSTLLPQILKQKQAALIIDQTGEMIEKYYDPSRGDIIFNPLDERSHSWDFFADIGYKESRSLDDSTDLKKIDNASSSSAPSSLFSHIPNPLMKADLEKFAKILFGYGKSLNSSADPFWSNSAETVFCSIVSSLLSKHEKPNISDLQKMLSCMSIHELKEHLQDTEAARYLSDNNKTTAASILSVMTAGVKPLTYLIDSTDLSKSFSLNQYFKGVKEGSSAVLFISSPPSMRESLLPLISCIFELGVSKLINIGINQQRRFWFIIDELASLKKLGGLSTLISEGRKYGACIIASTQSISQLFDIYGYYTAGSLFTNFATKFFFRNDEPQISKIITDIFGQVEYKQQHKNISFGAHEHRDGISYSESSGRKSLITADMLATLKNLECFVGLPDPEVRIAKIKMDIAPKSNIRNEGYVEVRSRGDLENRGESNRTDNAEGRQKLVTKKGSSQSKPKTKNSNSNLLPQEDIPSFELTKDDKEEIYESFLKNTGSQQIRDIRNVEENNIENKEDNKLKNRKDIEENNKSKNANNKQERLNEENELNM